MKEFVEKLISRLEERKMHLMKNFVLANVAFSSKQKALDRINEIDGAIPIVNQLAEEYNNGWIPCSVRLPEKYGEYLWCDKNGEYMIGRPHAMDSNGNYYAENEYEIMNDCIAWQPLPELYKQKGE